MAIKPETTNLTASSVDILNAIRNSATANYQNYIPVADGTMDSVREIGTIMMQYPTLQNEFLSALVNRIGRVLITNKMYSNPWTMFKKGLLEFGETIEDIFVNIAKPFEFDPAVSESEVFKREIPDVRSAFHIMNYQKFYKTTVSQDQLRQAFLSWTGITDLISKIVDSLYTGANYDEYQTMKYMLAKHILNGNLYAVETNEVTEETAKSFVSTVKGVSNNIEFLSDKYNRSGVHTFTTKDNQYLIMNSTVDAVVNVEVLAQAFNMDKAQFAGHNVLVDGFGNLDTDRLNQLFDGNEWYVPLTDDELNALNSIPAVLVDEDWFMILDNVFNFTEQYNGQGLYWNYWYHTWKTFSVSPFANAIVFVAGAPSVTSVKVSPETATTTAGQTVQLSANVETANYATKEVNWSVDDGEKASVDIYGKVYITDDATGTVTVTATSVFDTTKSGTATITISE